MKVLIVDDNDATVRIIQELITSEDHRVRTAGDGIDAYWIYLHFEPDLVITDIEMPGKNGFELIKKIRTHNPGIKTIYMSGDLSRFDSLLNEEKTRYDASVLGKPFSMDDLIQLVSDNQRSLQSRPKASRLRLIKSATQCLTGHQKDKDTFPQNKI